MFKKLKIIFQKKKSDLDESLKPSQNIRIKVGNLPQTFATRVEDVDSEKVFISGISNEELNYSVVLPNQKIELFMYIGPYYYKSEAVLKEKMTDPVYIWVLSRPGRFQKYKERRKAFRLDNVVEAPFTLSDDFLRDQKQALTTNVSITGLAIVSRENLPIRKVIRLSLLQAGTINGMIVWKYRRPDFDKWFYGVHFMNASVEQQEYLSRYINERVGKLRWAGFI